MAMTSIDSKPATGKAAMDMETRLSGEPGSEATQTLRLWLRLLSSATLIETEIRARLRTEFDTTLPRFDLMAQLERHPEGLRMGELSKRMMVTGANITGITDQLEQENLVQRMVDSSDRRAFSVKLTPLGRANFSVMATQHEIWVSELFNDLSSEKKSQLYDLLAVLKQGGRQRQPKPDPNPTSASALNPIRSLL